MKLFLGALPATGRAVIAVFRHPGLFPNLDCASTAQATRINPPSAHLASAWTAAAWDEQ